MIETVTTILMVIYLCYIAWIDVHARKTKTIINIAALTVLTSIIILTQLNTFTLHEWTMYGIQALGIGLCVTVLTNVITTSGLNTKTFMYSMPIFSLLSFLYIILSPHQSMMVAIVFIVAGILIWSIFLTIKDSIVSKNRTNGILWTVTYLMFIFLMYTILMNEIGISAQTSKLFIFINFYLPIGMQMNTRGFGNGDVFLIWLLTAFFMFVDSAITKGFGVLLYASMLTMLAVPIRTAYYMKKEEYGNYKKFIFKIGSMLGLIAIIITVLYKLTSYLMDYINNANITGTYMILVVFLTMIGLVIGSQKVFKFIMNKNKDYWDEIQQFVDSIPSLKQEPFAVEILIAFIITLIVGSPATLFMEYVPMPTIF